jgi:2-oxoglutarate ferredoxin oxidoreductase subunit beta
MNLTTSHFPNFCPGCGDLGIWAAFKNAAISIGWDNTNAVIVAGIGCHGHLTNFIKITSFEGLHGRALPLATGIKLVNPRLNVFVVTGDGDLLAEGGNHFIHACRRNHDLTILLHNNAVYGLTTGQTSPTSPRNYKSKSTPAGNPDEPIHPLTLAIASGATFVARAYAGDIPFLADMIIKANNHQGLSTIDILQPCITFNKEYTHQFFQQNIYKLGSDYDPTNKTTAFTKSLEWGPKQIPLGIIYQEDRPLPPTPNLRDQIPQNLVPSEARDISELLKKYQ